MESTFVAVMGGMDTSGRTLNNFWILELTSSKHYHVRDIDTIIYAYNLIHVCAISDMRSRQVNCVGSNYKMS